MFALIINYIKEPSIVLNFSESHGQWVTKNFHNGTFLFAGQMKSKLGGIILVKTMQEIELKKIISEDPYLIHHLVSYQIIEIECKAIAPNLTELLMI